MVRVIQGEALATLQTLETASVDALVTDPPYSSGGMTRGDRMAGVHTKYVQSDSSSQHTLQAFGGDNRDQRAYAYWCALWLAECLRVVKPGGSCVVFTDWRQLPSTTDAIQAGGWVWRGVVAWDKTEGVRPRSGFSAQCEYAVWGTAGPLREDYAVYLPGYIRSKTPRERRHITQKPVELMRRLCEIAPPGGVVLDPFMGSGTTLRAAKDVGRDAIGIEMNGDFCQYAEERLGQEVLVL